MRPRTARRLGVGVTSLVLHGLVGWALLAGARPTLMLVEPPTMDVALTPPPAAPDRVRTPPDQPTLAPSSTAPSTAPPPAPTAPPRPAGAVSVNPPAPPAGVVAPPGFTARGSLTGGGEALRQAARQSGCTEADIVKLTKAERDACAERLGGKNKNGPALYAAIDPDKKAAFDGDCKKDDDWCLYRAGKGPYPGLFALGKKRKIKGWD